MRVLISKENELNRRIEDELIREWKCKLHWTPCKQWGEKAASLLSLGLKKSFLFFGWGGVYFFKFGNPLLQVKSVERPGERKKMRTQVKLVYYILMKLNYRHQYV